MGDGSRQEQYAWLIRGLPWQYPTPKANAVAGTPEDRFAVLFAHVDSLEAKEARTEAKLVRTRRSLAKALKRIKTLEGIKK